MSKRQKSIAVSEFFYKNRHLLGFDNPRKALLTTIKEAVDNSLDACEEAGILPDIEVRVEMVSDDRFRVTVQDNGPGIVPKNVGPVFGKLLYGSKFHRLKMSRGQQGIGISAAGMYAMMTTGKPVSVLTRTGARKPAYYCELQIDTKQNEAIILREDPAAECPFPHGTRVSMELQAKYQKGRASVDEYLEQTAIANPHAQITYFGPAEKVRGTVGAPPAPVSFPRGVTELPPEAKEIKPHPYGVELGTLLKMLQDTKAAGLVEFLTEEFSRVNVRTAKSIIAAAGLRDGAVPHDLDTSQADPLYKAIQRTAWHRLTDSALKALAADGIPAEVVAKLKALPVREFATEKAFLDACEEVVPKEDFRRLRGKLLRNTQEDRLPPPPTDCLAPIGAKNILQGLLKEVKPEFITAETRDPAVYRGNPFQVEVALAYGGGLTETCRLESESGKDGNDGPPKYGAMLYRFANRVPLQYQQSACCTFKTCVEDVDWKRYGLDSKRGGLPGEPMVVMVHVASVWVPFTSESKEAIADYDAIREEIRLGLQECGRKLQTYVKRRDRVREEGERRTKFLRYIGEVVDACAKITGATAEETEKLRANLLALANKKTERADLQFDQDGNVIRTPDKPEADAKPEAPDENTLIIEQNAAGAAVGTAPDASGAAEGTTPSASSGETLPELAPLSEAPPPPAEPTPAAPAPTPVKLGGKARGKAAS
jgi:DNA topoisomerase-6 subunit B